MVRVRISYAKCPATERERREMIQATGGATRYQTRFSNEKDEALADTTADKGGGGSGFRPHDLLEAALATCVNMTVRMYADNHGIPLSGVTTRVSVDRSVPEKTTFRYDLEFAGPLTPEQLKKLYVAANACPVRRTLSNTIQFDSAFTPKSR